MLYVTSRGAPTDFLTHLHTWRKWSATNLRLSDCQSFSLRSKVIGKEIDIINDKLISPEVVDPMAAITIRNLPDETHRALKALARKNGRSTESEVRMILNHAVMPDDRLQLGSLLVSLGQLVDGLEFESERTSPSEPIDFS